MPGLTRVDTGAILLSALCVVHCLAVPLAITLAPMLTLSWIDAQQFHWGFLLLALPLSLVGLWRGFRRHASWLVPAIGALGLALMTYDLLPAHDDHLHGLTLIGVGLVALAHGLNIRGIRRHSICEC